MRLHNQVAMTCLIRSSDAGRKALKKHFRRLVEIQQLARYGTGIAIATRSSDALLHLYRCPFFVPIPATGGINTKLNQNDDSQFPFQRLMQ